MRSINSVVPTRAAHSRYATAATAPTPVAPARPGRRRTDETLPGNTVLPDRVAITLIRGSRPAVRRQPDTLHGVRQRVRGRAKVRRFEHDSAFSPRCDPVESEPRLHTPPSNASGRTHRVLSAFDTTLRPMSETGHVRRAGDGGDSNPIPRRHRRGFGSGHNTGLSPAGSRLVSVSRPSPLVGPFGTRLERSRYGRRTIPRNGHFNRPALAGRERLVS